MAYKTVSQAIESSTYETNTGATVEKYKSQVSHVSGAVSRALSEVAQIASDAIVLALDTKWLAVGLTKPAVSGEPKIGTRRYEREYLYSVRLGDYYLPVSQNFSLRAKKRLNVSSLVDGVDIIQQTRKEAKTIDCSIRVTLRNNQPNLTVVSEEKRVSAVAQSSPEDYDETNGRAEFHDLSEQSTEMSEALTTFAQMLEELYEQDAVFKVENQMINDVFGVNYAIISEYTFRPKVGYGTFEFNFTLTEVSYGEDVITLNVNTIGGK